jgi:hypothetical protein
VVAKEPEPVLEKSKSTVKQNTTWIGPSDKITKKDLASIDYSAKDTLEDAVKNAKEQYLGGGGDGLDKNFIDDDQDINLTDSDSDDDVKKTEEQKPVKKGLFSKFTSGLKNLTGNMVNHKKFLNT